MATKKKIINHIGLLLDGSGSISHLVGTLIKLSNAFIQDAISESKKNKQENRISVYGFSNTLTNLFFDVDVNHAPEVTREFFIGNQTALIESTIKVLDEMQTISQLHGDHAFLLNVFTDGENNMSNYLANTLAEKINKLPENITVSVSVPNQSAFEKAKLYGFPAGNIQIWEATTEKGVTEGFDNVVKSTQSYYASRSVGVKGTKNLFTPNVNFTAKEVKKDLEVLPAGKYSLLPIHPKKSNNGKIVIKDFVESWTTKPYVPGASYFQLTKPETLQPYKQVAVLEKSTGKVYSGANARELLGLPDYEVKVAPASHKNYTIFVQSSSLNRLLVPSTQLLVMH